MDYGVWPILGRGDNSEFSTVDSSQVRDEMLVVDYLKFDQT